MPIYEYKCDQCASIDTINDTMDGPLKQRADAREIQCTCGGTYTRRFSFSTPPMVHSHYNHTVGDVVSGNKDFADKLKRLSESNTLRTGIESHLAPIDHRDLVDMAREKYGDRGLREQHDAAVKRGEREPTGRMVF